MMENRFEIRRIFEESLSKLEEGALIEDLLAAHPHLAAELAPLLKTDGLLRAALTEQEPSDSFADALEVSLLDSLKNPPHPAKYRLFSSYKSSVLRARLAAAAGLLFFTLFGGASALSMNTLPNSPLYALKRGAESARLALALSDGSKARLHIELAQKRLDEAKSLAGKEAVGAKEALMAEFDNNIRLAEDLAAGQVSKDKALLLAKAADLNDPAQAALEPSLSNQPLDLDVCPIEGDAFKEGRSQEGKGTAAPAYRRASLSPLEVSALTAAPLVFSPNADSVKDEVNILLKAASGQKLKAAIFRGDIAILADLEFIESAAARSYQAVWNGRTADGGSLDNGVYTIKVKDDLGRLASSEIRVILDTAAPSFSLQAPYDGQVFESYDIVFAWQTVGDAASYALEIAAAPDFRSGTLLTFKNLADNTLTLDASRLKGGPRYVRVLCTDRAGNVSSTTARTFSLAGDDDKS